MTFENHTSDTLAGVGKSSAVADRDPGSVGPPGFSTPIEPNNRLRTQRTSITRWIPLVAGAFVLAALVAVALGALTGGGPSAAKQEAELTGYWDVTGVVDKADAGALQVPGETLHRLWRIDRTCAAHVCTLRLTRQVAGSTNQTIGGTLSAQLHWSSGHWLATFIEPYVACEGDTTGHGGVEISTWTIGLTTAGTVTAREHTDTQNGGSCLRTTSEITWSAHRLNSANSSSA